MKEGPSKYIYILGFFFPELSMRLKCWVKEKIFMYTLVEKIIGSLSKGNQGFVYRQLLRNLLGQHLDSINQDLSSEIQSMREKAILPPQDSA